MKIEEKKLIAIFIFLAIFAGFFFYGNWQINEKLRINALAEQKRITEIKNRINSLALEAKAISVYDLELDKEIYGKNAHKILPLASLAKTMTILIALEEYIPAGIIKISSNSLDQDGDNGLFLNENWKLEDLAEFTLIASSNDGAFALANGIDNFIFLMNTKAKEIGMGNTEFYNSTGLDIDSARAGAYGNALEANSMAIYALKTHPDIFNSTVLPQKDFKSTSNFVHNIQNRDVLTKNYNNFLFSKTGFTNLAGGNLTVIFKNKDDQIIAITVLGSSMNGRFSDMEKLINVL